MSILTIDVGIKNLAICALDVPTKKIRIWKILNVGYGTNICKAIICEFDAIEDIDRESVVLIERQMTRKMTNIQSYIEMYVRMRGFSEVIIYSPVHKLGGTGKENSGKGKDRYHARKAASVSLCKEWMDANVQDEWVTDLWAKTKKKDDLADTLCMALSYVKNPIIDASNVFKKVCARKPTVRQENTGNYSKSNIKYLLQNLAKDKPISLKLGKAIAKFWKSLEVCLAELRISRA